MVGIDTFDTFLVNILSLMGELISDSGYYHSFYVLFKFNWWIFEDLISLLMSTGIPQETQGSQEEVEELKEELLKSVI